MAENFQAGICGESCWSSLRGVPFTGGASPCSAAANDGGGFGWVAADLAMSNVKARSFEHSDYSLPDSSMVFENNHYKAQPRSAVRGCGRGELVVPDLQVTGFGISSPMTPDWNQALLGGGGKFAQSNYGSILNEDMSSRIQKDWSPKSYSSCVVEDSSMNGFKQINQEFSSDQSELTSITTSSTTTATCEGFSAGFPMGSGLSGGGLYGFPLIQSLLDEPADFQPQHQSILNTRARSVNSFSQTMNSDDQSPPSFAKLSSLLKPSSVNSQPNRLPLSNIAMCSTPMSSLDWTAASPPTIYDQKPSCATLNTKRNCDDAREVDSAVKKSSSAESGFKRPRIETPSPLPTFKVRKEKLGDRITALQQLVSPFGKTDTASVLHEAIEYIKFLHDQVHVLSTPYMRNGAPSQHQQGCDKPKDYASEGPKQDLRSRGLCLVPISSTFPVAHETPVDFWTPTFGGSFR
ncbi:transcription factor bHLH112-like [Syzygium oleosum]|uniref:transcription factor bHLH112-like n=1 Tax=Syzygium oleosum TaxID=219896 RepID=UPI0011D25AF4|nr:transcription factor bHLH112-like [Syzygium oleosum]